MENPEEILHSLEEFSKTKPKDIPRELEEYLCFVAKTGDPVYQWSAIKSLFREKMVNVITDFYETCPSMEIPPCPNVDLFNYDVMKNFILEKLDTFAAAPFTLQRICELLTTPRKEYNRIDKYMRALEKNILVVSTIEPGGRRNTENGEGIMNGLESDHITGEIRNNSKHINEEEMVMDQTPSWRRLVQKDATKCQNSDTTTQEILQETVVAASKTTEAACTSTSQESVITCRTTEETYVSIEPVPTNTCGRQEEETEEASDVSVTITAIPAGVQKRRNSVEPVVSSDETPESTESTAEAAPDDNKANKEEETVRVEEEEEQQEADSSSNQEKLDEVEEAKETPQVEETQEEEEESTQNISDPVSSAVVVSERTSMEVYEDEEEAIAKEVASVEEEKTAQTVLSEADVINVVSDSSTAMEVYEEVEEAKEAPSVVQEVASPQNVVSDTEVINVSEHTAMEVYDDDDNNKCNNSEAEPIVRE